MHRINKDAIFLIDGSAFLYRAYYGLRPLHAKDGTPVQAVYGFCRMIKKLIDDFKPACVALVWDTKGKTTRSEMYEEYKATRQAPPSDLFMQKDYIVEFADLIGLRQIGIEGYEADDIIATLAKDLKSRQIVIVSSDKDLRQLISDRILVFDPMKDRIIDRDDFIADNKFEPEQLLMYHALLGDASDNIPGVRGVGKKSAKELTEQFGTLENLYKNLDAVKSTRAKNALKENKENAFLSRDLFILQDVDTGLSIEDLEFDSKSLSDAAPLFKQLGFTSLLRAFAPQVAAAALKKATESKDTFTGGWTCHLVQDEKALDTLIEKIKTKKLIALDTELTGIKRLQAEMVGLSFAYDAKSSYYVPCGHLPPIGTIQLNREIVVEKLRPLLEDENIKKVLQNAKFDALVLSQYNITLNGIVFDTMIAANLLRKPWEKIGLKVLSEQYLGESMASFAEILGKLPNFAHVPLERAARYGAFDSLQTFKLYKVLNKALEKEPILRKLFDKVEMPMSRVLTHMERVGMYLDVTILQGVQEKIEQKLARIEGKIRAAVAAVRGEENGDSINLNSPQQLEILLFDDFGLTPIKRSKEGRRSTNHSVLIKLAEEHPVPGMILEYRELFKLKSTYCDPLPSYINRHSGRIHTTFNQTDVVTGRLSSNRPNLQNIPASGKLGKAIRGAFTAPGDRLLLSADYSQIDLRVLAHLSKDKTLTDAFLEGRDIHLQTAAEIFNVPMPGVTGEQRSVGKRINFSIIYGLTPYGLSRDLGIKPSEAKEYIERYFAKYPGVGKWMEKVVKDAKESGYVETYYGRRRYVPELHEKNHTRYELGRRLAINTPVQGTSAEIIKLAMIELDAAFEKNGTNAAMVLQVHDELIIECDKKRAEQVAKLVKEIMEGVVNWTVPLVVDVRLGENWEEISK